MPEEIDLNDEEEAALERAWENREGKKLPPPSPLLKDGDESGPDTEPEPEDEPNPPTR